MVSYLDTGNSPTNKRENMSEQTNNLETLHHCFEYLNAKLDCMAYTSPEFTNYLHTGGISYGQTWRGSFELVTPKGNIARKAFQVCIERTQTGLYNVNAYTL